MGPPRPRYDITFPPPAMSVRSTPTRAEDSRGSGSSGHPVPGQPNTSPQRHRHLQTHSLPPLRLLVRKLEAFTKDQTRTRIARTHSTAPPTFIFTPTRNLVVYYYTNDDNHTQSSRTTLLLFQCVWNLLLQFH